MKLRDLASSHGLELCVQDAVVGGTHEWSC